MISALLQASDLLLQAVCFCSSGCTLLRPAASHPQQAHPLCRCSMEQGHLLSCCWAPGPTTTRSSSWCKAGGQRGIELSYCLHTPSLS